jgi:hypothetical protein
MTQDQSKSELTLSRCPKCMSTDRTKYHNVREMPMLGKTAAGQPFNTIVWRRTKCTSCGQFRVDRSYEMRSKRARVAKPKTKTPQGGQFVSPPKAPKNTAKQAAPANKTPTAKAKRPTKTAGSIKS